jgi:hypothetical protein
LFTIFIINLLFFPKSKIGSLVKNIFYLNYLYKKIFCFQCHQTNLRLKAYIVSYLAFISLIVASSYFSISHLQTTKFLSGYDQNLYEKYILHIYNNTDLRNNLIGINGNNSNNTRGNLINCDISLRFMEPNPFQIVIFIWVIGFIWQEIKQVFGLGIRVYLTSHNKSKIFKFNI